MTADEAEIRRILEDWRAAAHNKDAAAMLSRYAPDARLFDLAPPLETRGPDVDGLGKWLATWDGPVDFDTHDLEVAIGDGVAFATGLRRMRATQGGEPTDLWARVTFGCRKIESRWMIAHEHVSVPFYMDGSDRAALDLKP